MVRIPFELLNTSSKYTFNILKMTAVFGPSKVTLESSRAASASSPDFRFSKVLIYKTVESSLIITETSPLESAVQAQLLMVKYPTESLQYLFHSVSFKPHGPRSQQSSGTHQHRHEVRRTPRPLIMQGNVPEAPLPPWPFPIPIQKLHLTPPTTEAPLPPWPFPVPVPIQKLYLTPPTTTTPLFRLPNELLDLICLKIRPKKPERDKHLYNVYGSYYYGMHHNQTHTSRGQSLLSALHSTPPRLTCITARHLFPFITVYAPAHISNLQNLTPYTISQIRHISIFNITANPTKPNYRYHLHGLFTILRDWDNRGLVHRDLKVTIAVKVQCIGWKIPEKNPRNFQLRYQTPSCPYDWESYIYRPCLLWHPEPTYSNDATFAQVAAQFKTLELDFVFFEPGPPGTGTKRKSVVPVGFDDCGCDAEVKARIRLRRESIKCGVVRQKVEMGMVVGAEYHKPDWFNHEREQEWKEWGYDGSPGPVRGRRGDEVVYEKERVVGSAGTEWEVHLVERRERLEEVEVRERVEGLGMGDRE
ncbi:hypothetical protein BJ508DRAFT_337414 [Ascobolus immersus RN42]|uniref:Uncharacterized protein n=1 Tax=Ascobolus immersus RN42 TaxID=1160509 RepID=A0A3N4IV01_ASCIM|nr:hypothetical protein BJ508DRAFT_337414 [Ascobolus immersus RN42]